MKETYGEHIHHHITIDVTPALKDLLERLADSTGTDGQLSSVITEIKAHTKSKKAKFNAVAKGIKDAIQ